MKQQKIDIREHLALIPSEPPRIKRPHDNKKAVWMNEKVKGNTQGLQMELWPYKGQQLTI